MLVHVLEINLWLESLEVQYQNKIYARCNGGHTNWMVRKGFTAREWGLKQKGMNFLSWQERSILHTGKTTKSLDA